jgi:hypothetical protein
MVLYMTGSFAHGRCAIDEDRAGNGNVCCSHDALAELQVSGRYRCISLRLIKFSPVPGSVRQRAAPGAQCSAIAAPPQLRLGWWHANLIWSIAGDGMTRLA